MQIEVQQRRKYPNILVTGTPGTGKTTFAKLLNTSISNFNFKYLNVGQLVIAHQLYKSVDQEFQVPEFDEDMVIDFIEDNYPVMQGGLLVDFHSCDFFPERFFDIVVLLRCNNTVLYDRLLSRGYSQKKITQNLQYQIMEASHDQVFESYPRAKILELSNQKEEDVGSNIDQLLAVLGKW